jgi:DNA mismatch repair ATPase MutS
MRKGDLLMDKLANIVQSARQEFPGRLILVRTGPLFQAVGPDAQVVARLCDVPLTQRSRQGQPTAERMCSLEEGKLQDHYLPLLQHAGHQVHILERAASDD